MSQLQSPFGDGASRRDFLKVSTTAAVVGSLSIAQSAHAAGDDLIRIGVIGCGGRGTGAAKQALSTKGNVKLVAMGDAFGDELEQSLKNLQRDNGIAAKIDVPPERRFSGFNAYQQVIGAGVDLVVLATPPGFRPMHLKAAVDAGKHVFMEKPVAVDAPGVRSVLSSVAEAKKQNLAIGVGLQRRHQMPYLETIKKLQDGAIGDIIAARVYWNGAGVWEPRRTREQCKSEMEYQMRNWYYYNWLCGDHIVEQHIHNLDVINWLKNAYPISAQGMGGREVRKDPKYGEIFDHHYVEFEYADGSRMYSCCRHIKGCWSSVSEHVHGSKGSADISKALIIAQGQEPWKYRGPTTDPYQQEHDDMQAAIRAGTPYNEGEFGAFSSMTSILGRMATYSGVVVPWNKAIESQHSLAPKEYSFEATPPIPSVAIPGVTPAV